MDPAPWVVRTSPRRCWPARFSYLVRQLANFANQERDSHPMHALLAQPDLRNPQAWVDVASFLNKAPIDRATIKGDGSHIALGRGIFHEQCASCHEPDARGSDDGFTPSLRNQNYPYLVEPTACIGQRPAAQCRRGFDALHAQLRAGRCTRGGRLPVALEGTGPQPRQDAR
jgi:cytochrome c553